MANLRGTLCLLYSGGVRLKYMQNITKNVIFAENRKEYPNLHCSFNRRLLTMFYPIE